MGTVISLYEHSPVSGSGNRLGQYVLDGGRGLSGQGSGLVVCGLGDYVGQKVEYRLHMANVSVVGTADVGTIEPLAALNRSGALDVTPTLAIDSSTVKCTVEFQPATGLLDWRFTWTTNAWSPSENDIVHLSGTGCGFGSIDLDGSVADVDASVTYVSDAQTGERYYTHQIIWHDRPCQVGCNYDFSVESETSGPSPSSSTETGTGGRIKVCPQSI